MNSEGRRRSTRRRVAITGDRFTARSWPAAGSAVGRRTDRVTRSPAIRPPIHKSPRTWPRPSITRWASPTMRPGTTTSTGPTISTTASRSRACSDRRPRLHRHGGRDGYSARSGFRRGRVIRGRDRSVPRRCRGRRRR